MDTPNLYVSMSGMYRVRFMRYIPDTCPVFTVNAIRPCMASINLKYRSQACNVKRVTNDRFTSYYFSQSLVGIVYFC